MTRLIGILSTYALQILGAALLLVSIAWAVQTWRIGNLQADRGRLEMQLDAAVGANQTNQRTIEAMRRANAQNQAQYVRVQDEARRASKRAARLESQLSQRAGDDIAQIESTTDKCARQPLPADIRDRLRDGGDRDADSRGSSRAPGPG